MARRRPAEVASAPRRTNAPAGHFYTAQDVADFCEVDLKTVHHWVTRGKIVHQRTEGRHLRFRRNDVLRFLRAHEYPLPIALRRVKPRVAIAGADSTIAEALAARASVSVFPSAIALIAHV